MSSTEKKHALAKEFGIVGWEEMKNAAFYTAVANARAKRADAAKDKPASATVAPKVDEKKPIAASTVEKIERIKDVSVEVLPPSNTITVTPPAITVNVPVPTVQVGQDVAPKWWTLAKGMQDAVLWMSFGASLHATFYDAIAAIVRRKMGI